MEGIQAKLKEVIDWEVRAVKVEEDLRSSASELERVTGQATALATERDALKAQLTELETLKTRISRRNDQLKISRKTICKGKKMLERTGDKVFQMGYDEAIQMAHSSGLDHTLLLEEGMSDPVGREDVDEPLIVSSGEDEELLSE